MKLRAYAPALLAVAALVAIYLFVARDKSKAPAAAQHTPAAPAQRAPAAPAQQTPPAPAPSLTPEAQPAGEVPTGVPRALTPEEYAGHEPKANKPPMVLEEKLAETKQHIVVMERRAHLLEAEIAELERKGENEKAAQQRVVLKRLNEHADKLRQAVAEGREPQ
jgi:hypothetical protein